VLDIPPCPHDVLSSDLAQAWRALRSRIDTACVAAGRDRGAVSLLPVTKSVDVESALALHALGARELGENRVDELERKAARFAESDLPVRWHFIGNLQRNKARRVARVADVVHSVSGPRLLDTLARVAAEENRVLEIYLEVHLSSEDEKQGFAADELPEAVRFAGDAPALRLLGLMTMAPRRTGSDDDADRAARAAFDRCAQLADERLTAQPDCFASGHAQLSMGMTGDLESAIAAGSTCVRVGSALFAGARGGAA